MKEDNVNFKILRNEISKKQKNILQAIRRELRKETRLLKVTSVSLKYQKRARRNERIKQCYQNPGSPLINIIVARNTVIRQFANNAGSNNENKQIMQA